MKKLHPVTRAACGIAALVAIVISANWLISLTPLGNRGIDFTENRIHTLSDGTRAILGDLDAPVVIRYYASRNSDYLPEQVKLHMRRVDDMLQEYARLSNGKLRLENLDPEPDTDAEDSANLDGISGQKINDQNLYFGMAISCLDQTRVIPFLNPGDETMLEYDLSRAISEVSAPTKPVIGIMSALDLQGSPAMMPGQRPSPGWIIYDQLARSYEVRDLTMEPEAIDPGEIKALFVFHPAGITPAAEYAIDQYVLGGGTVIACLDAFSVAAQMTGGGNPMMGAPPAATTSTLPTLLKAWGLEFTSDSVIADPTYSTMVAAGTSSPALLTLPANAMPQEDNVITRDLTSVTFLLPGGIRRLGGAGVETSALLRTTSQAAPVNAERALQLDPSLLTSLRPSGTPYDLVTYLSGTFKSAFPHGRPADPATDPEETEESPSAQGLTSGTAKANVFVIADVDAFFDDYAFSVQNFAGMRYANQINGNASLLFNIIDQAAGSPHLIGSRSRAAQRRPFDKFQEMETAFNLKRGKKIEEFQSKANEAIRRIEEMEQARDQTGQVYGSAEQETALLALRKEQVEAQRSVREMEKGLRRQKDKLAGTITLINVAAMPSLVVILGFFLMIGRRASTRAR